MTDITGWLDRSDYDTHPSFKFAAVGATIAGTIVGPPRLVDTDDLNGGTSTKLVLDVLDDKGETWTVWVKPGRMARAVSQAVKTAGRDAIEEGGTIKLRYDADGDPTKPGFHPPKLFKCKYEPPKTGVPVDDDLF